MSTDQNPERPIFTQLESRPLDPVFHSFYQAGPFTNCIECKERFVAGSSYLPYLIMKTYVHTEVIIEIAICWNCRSQMQSELSQQSEQSIRKFLAEKFRSEAHIESCAVCNRKRDKCRSYSIYAFCNGEEMFVGQYPFMACDQCEEVMQELLSEETRGWQDDFMDRHFSGPSLQIDPKLYPMLI